MACMSWPVCLGLYVLACMSWPVCLGLYALACMPWFCCLGIPVRVRDLPGPNARGEPPRHVRTAAWVKATIGAVGSSALLGPAPAAGPVPPTPGAVRRRAGGGGVVQGACGLGLYALARMSWPVCLGLYVLACMSWPVCLGLYALACVSWGCCFGFTVLAFLFEYGICRGLTPRFRRRRKPKRRRSVGCRRSPARDR